MTNKDHQIIFTALGFLAIILRDEAANENHEECAVALARRIETFCIRSTLDSFADECRPDKPSLPATEHLLELYIEELREANSARPAFDRQTLLRMYELLTIHKMRHEQAGFYAAAYDDVIAESVLHLAKEKIHRETTRP